MPAATRPSLALFTSEPLRAAGDLLGHLRRRRGSDRPQRGDGHAVVLFPGLATDGMSLWPLCRYLAGLGYHALDWGQGFNTRPRGEVDSWLAALADSVLSKAQAQPAHAGPVSLIGWSLGGLYAREIAKLAPDRVRRVITIGTPFNGTTQQTNVGWLFRMLNRHAPLDAAQLRERLASPPPVPTTAIYSRRDGVVAWQACRHGRNPGIRINDVRRCARSGGASGGAGGDEHPRRTQGPP